MVSRARWEIESWSVDDPARPIVIRDVGPWDEHPSVTNDAEGVIEELAASKMLNDGAPPVFYFDSEGEIGELKHQGGRFTGFRSVAHREDLTFFNPAGSRCEICASRSGHTHPAFRCHRCGGAGHWENLVIHLTRNCHPKEVKE